MREICMSGWMRGVWKRNYGRATKAPPDERGGNRHAQPTVTAPHLDSTDTSRPECANSGRRMTQRRLDPRPTGRPHARNTPMSFLGRKRGNFVLVSNWIVENNGRVNTPARSQSAQQMSKPRSIGFLVYPDCEILDVCG